MYEVIGHEALRERLKLVDGSFAVLGPPGVGKKGIVAEWAGDRGYDLIPSLPVDMAKALAKKSFDSPGLTVLLDGDRVISWDPLLRPIEEGVLRVVVWATKILPPAASRMAVFPAGYLSEKEVRKILAKSFPTFGPRPWIAKALMGSFDSFKDVCAAVHVFEEINMSLAGKTFPLVLKDQPVAVLWCLKLAAAARVGVANLPWDKSALDAIPEDVAWGVLNGFFPAEKHQARNISTMFFAEVSGGRLG